MCFSEHQIQVCTGNKKRQNHLQDCTWEKIIGNFEMGYNVSSCPQEIRIGKSVILPAWKTFVSTDSIAKC